MIVSLHGDISGNLTESKNFDLKLHHKHSARLCLWVICTHASPVQAVFNLNTLEYYQQRKTELLHYAVDR